MNDYTAKKEQIFRYIDNAVPVAVELETELTKRPAISPESGGQGELDKAEFLETWLKGKGITQLERHDAPDPRAKGGVRPNLAATIPGKADTRRLWIMSHLDVVPPGEASLWQSDPWTVVQREGCLFGRGVEDNQQGLTASVIGALSLVEQGITPLHTVKLLFVADEEVGSAYGIIWLLKNRNLFRPDDMILIPDSGDPQGETLEIAEKNILWIQFTTKGLQSHGSRPDQGANAHLAGADLMVSLHDELGRTFADQNPLFEPAYSTFQPTKKEANVPNINTIPGEDVCYMDMRILPEYPVKTVLAEIDRIKTRIETKHNVTISYTVPQAMESKATPQDAPIIKLLAKAVKEVYQVNPRPIGIGGGTVAGPLRNENINAVVWSRMSHSAHQPNEYAVIDHILGNAKVMALLMMMEH
ncbi:MAG: M20 family metallo-hydrolase [Treponema sp.]|jgi:succinyl-diaminopimelate desuccinylase|nr:M20 family metallo-hydrolase [Treponema sp.]